MCTVWYSQLCSPELLQGQAHSCLNPYNNSSFYLISALGLSVRFHMHNLFPGKKYTVVTSVVLRQIHYSIREKMHSQTQGMYLLLHAFKGP